MDKKGLGGEGGGAYYILGKLWLIGLSNPSLICEDWLQQLFFLQMLMFSQVFHY